VMEAQSRRKIGHNAAGLPLIPPADELIVILYERILLAHPCR
jgi:hypothetical protein